jgi:hypothetical protein
MAQLLKAEILKRTSVFGGTATGADWCVKALHPSDPMTEVRGIPDESAQPSLLMNYQGAFTIAPHAGSTGTWSFNASLLPHPINFMVVDYADSVAPAGTYLNFNNAQVDGASDEHSVKYENFLAMAQRWRLAYMSATVYQDGADLSNQGTLVVSQPTVAARHLFTIPTLTTSNHPIDFYTNEDKPDFVTSQSMPNSYMGRSREGAYVPLKLSRTCQEWRHEGDSVILANMTGAPSGTGTAVYPIVAGYTVAWPHTDLQAYCTGSPYDTQRTSPMLNDTFAHVCARNLAVTTQYTIHIRCGIEMQLCPSSVLSPQLKLSPVYDPEALNTYFKIARELKDAYPADYNDQGKLWNVLRSVAAGVLPSLRLTPAGMAIDPAIQAIKSARQVGQVVVPMVQAARKKRQKKRKQRAKKQPVSKAT